MKTGMANIPSAQLSYQIYGDGDVSLVIEMGLGAAMAEWSALARSLSDRHTVLLYQRAGYGESSRSAKARTPENIAVELYQLLEQIAHTEKVTMLAHSQGGLYAWKFAAMFPGLVDKLVLLDPLSPEDHRFREELTEEEFRKSGVDKTGGLRLNLQLTRLHLGWLVRRAMRTAPPFYYYDGFSDEERYQILSAFSKPQTYQTALEEYAQAHDPHSLEGMLNKTSAPDIPVTLITHDPEIACREIREFGGASEAQAQKIEVLWQEIMQFYLSDVTDRTLVRAENSSHYIHLTDSDLVCGQL